MHKQILIIINIPSENFLHAFKLVRLSCDNKMEWEAALNNYESKYGRWVITMSIHVLLWKLLEKFFEQLRWL